MNHITAHEAQLLTEYKLNEDVVEATLDEIYSIIEKTARSGKFSVKILLQPIALKYTETIRTKLTSEGYKVKLILDKGYGEWYDYIKISWSK